MLVNYLNFFLVGIGSRQRVTRSSQKATDEPSGIRQAKMAWFLLQLGIGSRERKSKVTGFTTFTRALIDASSGPCPYGIPVNRVF